MFAFFHAESSGQANVDRLDIVVMHACMCAVPSRPFTFLFLHNCTHNAHTFLNVNVNVRLNDCISTYCVMAAVSLWPGWVN